MSFDSCKEDIEEGYPCECGGSVTKSLDGKKWECDSCNFTVSTNGTAQQQVKADSPMSLDVAGDE